MDTVWNFFKKNYEMANWLVAFGTILLAIIAVFKDAILSWYKRPKLKITIDLNPPDCHKTNMKAKEERKIEGKLWIWEAVAECFYFRFKIWNKGSLKAENVEVMITELKKKQATGKFVKVARFIPMNLHWSNYSGNPYMLQISPNIFKHCDFGYILNPAKRSQLEMEDDPILQVNSSQTIFSFSFIGKPFTMGHLIEPGTYKVTVLIAAANAKPIEQSYEIILEGQWFDEPGEMFSLCSTANLITH